MQRKSTVICPHCGTRQTRRETCISCGRELSLSREEELETLERVTEFTHTPFTKAVRAVSVVMLVTFAAALAILLIRGTHQAAPMLMLLFMSTYPALLTCAPITSYRYFLPRGRYSRYRRPDDFDDPYPSSIRGVYVLAAIFLAVTLVFALAYLYYFEKFRL